MFVLHGQVRALPPLLPQPPRTSNKKLNHKSVDTNNEHKENHNQGLLFAS
jgi:hypothetical protein